MAVEPSRSTAICVRRIGAKESCVLSVMQPVNHPESGKAES